MIVFEVKDMTCGHCASTITKAVKACDREAKVVIDLGQHLVTVEPGEADVQELVEAIQEAGYTPTQVQARAPEVPSHSAGCCGHCQG
jgi:copper chaperone